MPTIRIPKPLPHQVEPDKSPVRYKVLPWGRRAGKTVLAVKAAVAGHGPDGPDGPLMPGIAQGMDVVWLAPDYPQSAALWVSEVRGRFKGVEGIRVNENERTVDLSHYGGGTLWFRSMENIRSVRGSGDRVGGVIVEEAAHLDLEDALKSVLMPALTDNEGWLILISTTNAGRDGNAMGRTPSYFNVIGNEIRDGIRGPEWAMWHRTARDNPVITSSAFAALCAEYPDKSDPRYLQEIEATLLTIGVGVAFPEWREDLHVSRYEPGPNARWFAGLDWGYSAPGCFVLLAAEGDRTQARWDYRFERRTPYDVGYTLGQRLGVAPLHLPEWIVGDSAMWAVTDGGPTVAEEVQRGLQASLGPTAPALIPCQKGTGSRVAGKLLVHEGLKYEALEDGTVPAWMRPRLTVHPDAAYLHRTLPALPRDVRNPEDVDTTADDHAYDGVRYALMSRAPISEAPEKDIPQDRHPGWTATGRRRSRIRTEEVAMVEELEAMEASGVAVGGRYGRRG